MIKMFAATVAVGLFSPALVSAEVMYFGSLNAHYGLTESNDSESYNFNDRGVRFGIRGASYINEDLETSYFFEAESVIADGNDVANEIKQAWIGLRGSLGEFRIGRHLSPVRVSVDSVDMFDNQAADQNKILESDVVHDRSIAYINSFNSFGYAVVISTDNENSRISTDVLTNYSFEQFDVAAAYLKGSDHMDTLRLGLSYRFPGGHRLGIAVENLDDSKGNLGHDAFLVSGGYKAGKSFFKAQLGRNSPDTPGEAETLVGLGVDYTLGKSTELQFQYSLNKHRDHTSKDSERSLTLGLEYQF